MYKYNPTARRFRSLSRNKVGKMLTEEIHVRQIPGSPRRRWFSDNYFDLIVMYNVNDEIIEFHLHYDLNSEERALIWRRPSIYKHYHVDDGEIGFKLNKATPVLRSGGKFLSEEISIIFKEKSKVMEEELAAFVLEKIRSFN